MTMAPREVLRAQLETLRQDLGRCRNAAKAAKVEERLRNRVAAPFDTRLTGLQKQAEGLLAQMGTNQALGAMWQNFRELQGEAARVLDEALAFVQGALARKAALDQGVCDLTDTLLDDLAIWSDIPWGRFTLLSTSEFYRDTAEIIRIRYPEISLWSMPFAAHEFGHFVAGKRDYPLLSALDKNKGVGQAHSEEWHHASEYFSDLFATYTLGPAYAGAFILLRMNPADAYAETYTHPPAAYRVHGILWALGTMAAREATPTWEPFAAVTSQLRRLWTDSLQEVGQPTTLPDAAAALVTQRMGDFMGLLIDTTSPQLLLSGAGWNRVEALAANLQPEHVAPELTRREVLNAAWLARLAASGMGAHALNDLAAAALATYRRIGPVSLA